MADRLDRLAAAGVVQNAGLLDGDGVTAFLGDADLVLFPSVYANEAQPNVIIEALMSGVPVLTTPRGCSADLLGDDLASMVCDEGEFVPTAAALIRRLADRPSDLDDLTP